MTKKQRKIFYPVIFFLGLFLMIWGIEIFRITMIDKFILLGIIFLIGIITFFLDYKNYAKTYTKYSRSALLIYSMMHCILGYGFIACSIFMFTNYYFADEGFETKSFEIIERSSMAGGKNSRGESQPLMRINYDGKIKELVFKHEYYEKMNFYTEVELKISKGYFGFDLLLDKELK